MEGASSLHGQRSTQDNGCELLFVQAWAGNLECMPGTVVKGTVVSPSDFADSHTESEHMHQQKCPARKYKSIQHAGTVGENEQKQ